MIKEARERIGIFLKRRKGMEMEEIGKILLAVAVLLLVTFGIWFLFKGKGGDALAAIRRLLRFGR